jgi:hypothetical protein
MRQQNEPCLPSNIPLLLVRDMRFTLHDLVNGANWHVTQKYVNYVQVWCKAKKKKEYTD